MKYGGEHVSEIMAHEPSHKHTEAAYSILDDYLIGHYLVTKSYERPCERPDVKSLADLPPVYRETSIDSLADPLTFIKPRTGLLENKQLALGERKIAGSGQTYYLDPLHFMHTKSKGITKVEPAKDPAFGDDYYIKNLQDGVKSPSNLLSDQRLWYRIVLRVVYSLNTMAEMTVKASKVLFTPHGFALALLVALLIYDGEIYPYLVCIGH